MLLYVDPGTLMPIASALAAIGGVLMLFGRRVAGLARTLYRSVADLVRRLVRSR